MNNDAKKLIDRLAREHSLSKEDYAFLVRAQDEETAAYAGALAAGVRREVYGTDVYIRGLIEIGNICRNDCLYCGIRRSNTHADRYRLTEDEIFECACEGYTLGFRTFVMQGGEDGAFGVDSICRTVRRIKRKFPDCAVTLSLGEFPREDYEAMFAAGADRYLLRHETADRTHYEKLHPAEMSFENRMRCLRDLKDIGFQTGCGFMVGSPFQTPETLAEDLKFIETFRPAMCGIGPFIPRRTHPLATDPQERRSRRSTCSRCCGSCSRSCCSRLRPPSEPSSRTDVNAGLPPERMSSCPISRRFPCEKNTHSTTASCAPARRRRSASAACRGACSRSARISSSTAAT